MVAANSGHLNLPSILIRADVDVNRGTRVMARDEEFARTDVLDELGRTALSNERFYP
jgi:hypothetical protein